MKRTIENRIDELEEETDHGDGDLDVEFNIVHVMERERAEREGRTILGPAENAAEDIDAVEVPIDDD